MTHPLAPRHSSLGSGRFHCYTSYGAQNSQLYPYDFRTGALANITRDWPLHHALNAHFSPDGSTLVFMAFSGRVASQGEWEIYKWRIGDPNGSANLTRPSGKRDKDPNFSPDGARIVFKQNFQLATMNADGSRVSLLPIKSPGIAGSAPSYTRDGQRILFFEGASANSGVSASNGSGRRKLADESGLQEYSAVAGQGSRPSASTC